MKITASFTIHLFKWNEKKGIKTKKISEKVRAHYVKIQVSNQKQQSRCSFFVSSFKYLFKIFCDHFLLYRTVVRFSFVNLSSVVRFKCHPKRTNGVVELEVWTSLSFISHEKKCLLNLTKLNLRTYVCMLCITNYNTSSAFTARSFAHDQWNCNFYMYSVNYWDFFSQFFHLPWIWIWILLKGITAVFFRLSFCSSDFDSISFEFFLNENWMQKTLCLQLICAF